MRGGKYKLIQISGVIFFLLILISSSVFAQNSGQASIYLSPGQGTFTVGSTFDVSIFVNTGGADINAVSLDVKFSSDILQIVNPTAGNSFISVWITQPTYSNTKGSISFQGGLPSPGINTTSGLISTITFRAKAPGEALIRILSSSKVLANDGKGTDLLTSWGQGVYTLSIPAPEGPNIISSSHGDKNRWYKNNNPVFSWQLNKDENLKDEAELKVEDGQEEHLPVEYSWSFDEDSRGLPDNVVDGAETLASYEDVSSGIWYFHIKARVASIWGQTSHYPVKIDFKPPASFLPLVTPKTGNESMRRLVNFNTTDQHSGIDHYEIKIESLAREAGESTFFIEQNSPWQAPILPRGKYRVIARAYDLAGNYRDGSSEFNIRPSFFNIIANEGWLVGKLTIPWWLLIVLVIVLIILLLLLLRWWRRNMADPSDQLSQYLKDIRQRTGKERKRLKEELKEEEEIKDVLSEELSKISDPREDKKKFNASRASDNLNKNNDYNDKN